MIELDGITVSSDLQNFRNAYLYAEGNKWILSTRASKIAVFNNSEDAIAWWERFEELRGFSPRSLKNSKPKPKTKTKKKTKNNLNGAISDFEPGSFGWRSGKGICQVCHGDGGAKGQCCYCGGSGWA